VPDLWPLLSVDGGATDSEPIQLARTAPAGLLNRNISRGYWREGVGINFLWKKIPQNKEQAFFFSHLVAEMYKHAGQELLSGVPSEKIAPSALGSSPNNRQDQRSATE
jgi:hypothetical protein